MRFKKEDKDLVDYANIYIPPINDPVSLPLRLKRATDPFNWDVEIGKILTLDKKVKSGHPLDHMYLNYLSRAELNALSGTFDRASRGAVHIERQRKAAIEKISALNEHFLPKMYEDLKGKDPSVATFLTVKFAQALFEMDLLRPDGVPRYAYRMLSTTPDIFKKTVGVRAEKYVYEVLTRYLNTLNRHDIEAILEAQDAPVDVVVNGMETVPAMAILNCVELTGHDVGDTGMREKLSRHIVKTAQELALHR